MTKYLDYEGLKIYDGALKQHISDLLGVGYNVAEEGVNVKEYIDSRIFVGSAADVELALNQKKIDETTFTMVIDPDAAEVTSIPDSDIVNLFK